LKLFGLSENFTLDQLTASFRMLAKLNHPDINRDGDSKERMADINEGYIYLKEELTKGEYQYHTDTERQRESHEKAKDIFYFHYKQGFEILKSAFENYFGEGDDKSKKGNLDELKKHLILAKDEFSILINDLPHSQWVDDAIEKISSINRWLM
ncbi:MAG: hypothetical protein SVR08_18250, partial [Spirochaetota bacterium]|nr:hypothetical protein [Spirochaetota bacterium]